MPSEDRADAEALLRNLSQRFRSCTFVVTSRPIGYRSPDAEFREVRVLPFDRTRRREFLARWLGRRMGTLEEAKAEAALEVLASEPDLWELSGNPLYLTLMGQLLESGRTPERNRARLYDQVFGLLLSGRHRREAVEPMDRQEDVRSVLRRLGYALTEVNRDAEPKGQLEARLYAKDLDSVRNELERVPRWRRSMVVFLDDLSERTGILGPYDGPDADWRFRHRTFREALAAERMHELAKERGLQVVIAEAEGIQGDLGRWAEPYALFVGEFEEPDDWIRALAGINHPLALRALATAQNLRPETFDFLLETTGEPMQRAEVFRRLPELIGDPERALRLVERLRRRTRNGNDLFFLELAAEEIARRHPEHRVRAENVIAALFEHVPIPSLELFTEVATPLDGVVPLWRDVPSGTFLMGSPEGEGYDDEHPHREVAIPRAFRVASAPMTRAQYLALDDSHRSRERENRVTACGAESDLLPVVDVSRYEAVAFCRFLDRRVVGCAGARLPTEEEWEYVCRAGTTTRYWSGDSERDLARVAWYSKNSEGRIHGVGDKPANPWGLYDVHGNVLEWTASRYGADEVIRGGSFRFDAGSARSAYRLRDRPSLRVGNLGFRVVLPAPS